MPSSVLVRLPRAQMGTGYRLTAEAGRGIRSPQAGRTRVLIAAQISGGIDGRLQDWAYCSKPAPITFMIASAANSAEHLAAGGPMISPSRTLL